MDGDEYVTAEKWLRQRIGQVPKTAIGWFRAGARAVAAFTCWCHFFLTLMITSSPFERSRSPIVERARPGVGFYNKRQFEMSIDCFQESVRIDPLNVRFAPVGAVFYHTSPHVECGL